METSRAESNLSARLPDGTAFVPGVSCAGPNERGDCPTLRAGKVPACQSAIWLLESDTGRRWPFRFRAPLRTCPVTLLTATPAAIGSAT